ncbi:MAG: hypothetical protein AAF652_00040 [Cyanobacteria bacterium P01_C01_bin.72]
MKSLFLISLVVFALGSTGTITSPAQTTSDNPESEISQPPLASPSPSISAPLLQAAPLVQASSKLLGQQVYQIESKIKLTTNEIEEFATANAHLVTTIAAPDKVKAELTFLTSERDLERQYQIIANGTQVWIYDSQDNKYSVNEYPQFITSSEGITVGTLANFYLKTLHTINSNRIASRAISKLPPDRLLRYFQTYANLDLQNMTIRNEQLGNQNYTIYDLNAVDRSYQTTIYVQPQSSNIEQVNLKGQKDDLAITITEQIISQTPVEPMPLETFNFIPPDEAEEVESQIEIYPFAKP